MREYQHLFGEQVAQGLGLAREDDQRVVGDYLCDPAGAFTRAAARMEAPGEVLTRTSTIAHLIKPANSVVGSSGSGSLGPTKPAAENRDRLQSEGEDAA